MWQKTTPESSDGALKLWAGQLNDELKLTYYKVKTWSWGGSSKPLNVNVNISHRKLMFTVNPSWNELTCDTSSDCAHPIYASELQILAKWFGLTVLNVLFLIIYGQITKKRMIASVQQYLINCSWDMRFWKWIQETLFILFLALYAFKQEPRTSSGQALCTFSQALMLKPAE